MFIAKIHIISSFLSIDNDFTDINCTTGDFFTFSVTLKGYDGDEKVYVEYWFGSNSHKNVSMDGSNPLYYNITAPLNSNETMYYIFHAQDSLGYWIHSPLKMKNVYDNDFPKYGSDISPKHGATGNNFIFSIQVTDNIIVENVYVIYWFENGFVHNISMNYSSIYFHSINIPINSTVDMHYYFYAIDGAGNGIFSSQVNISIIDDELPILIEDNTLSVAKTGEKIEIIIKVEDNIQVEYVNLTYWFGNDGEKEYNEMTKKGSFYQYTIDISKFSIDPLWYQVSITDVSGLSSSYSKKSVTIIDDINPIMENIEDISIYLGEDVNISVISNDNIGVTSFEWVNTPIVAEENLLKGTPSKAGVFEITVTAFDNAGNSISRSFNLTILSEDHDTDGDGIPDLIEIEYGLSINDPLDANDDLDNDGLTNFEEYKNGTSLDNPDTDGDQMPDGWEIEHGLNPLLNISTNDGDGDGKTDLEEYIEGSDPHIMDSNPDEDKVAPILMIIIIIIIVIIVISIGLAVIILLKRRNIEAEGDRTKDFKNEEQSSKTKDEKAYEDLYGSLESNKGEF